MNLMSRHFLPSLPFLFLFEAASVIVLKTDTSLRLPFSGIFLYAPKS